MFKKFTTEDVSTQNQIKSSIQRGIRSKICELYPIVEEKQIIDAVLPKKEQAALAKLPDHVQVLVLNNIPVFFAERDGPWFPTLRLLHQYPDMMVKLRVDAGAIKFVMSGANIMCRGLTSPGATIHEEVEAGMPVAIYAEGKEHALAVGVTKLSTREMRDVNSGMGVDIAHYLNDGLWKCKEFS